jgi:hypothetical protein
MASIVLLILFSSFTHTQDDAVGMDESTLTSTQQQFDALEYYSVHPLDLRNITDELLFLPGMTHGLMRMIKRLIKQYPDIDNVEDLLNQSPKTIDTSIRRIILKCTRISNPQTQIHGRYRSRISLSIPETRGMREGVFLGSNEAFMQRLFIGNPRYTLALSYGKQSGEAYEHGMLHGSLQYSDKNYKMIIGDHSIEHGMGGLLASGISIADISKPSQRALRWSSSIRPTTSLLEFSNFRGIGGQYFMQSNNIKNTIGFSFSNRNRYATFNDEDLLTSFPISTYARTEHELNQREGTKELRLAMFNTIHIVNQVFSVAGLYQKYNHAIAPTAYSIGEQEQWMISFDMQSELNKEWTVSANALFDRRYNYGGMFTLHHDGGNHDQAIMIRHFDPNIRSPIGQSFGRSGICSNDQGIHFLLNGTIGSFKYAINSEIYSQISTSKNSNTLKKGIRMIGQLIHIGDKTTILCRVMNEIRSSDKPSVNVQTETDWRLRSEIAYRGTSVRSVIRMESHIMNTNSQSFGIGCALEFHSVQTLSPWNWSIRMAWSETDNFDSAIYLPETGLPGQLLIGPLYGLGMMSCGQIGYTFGKAKISVLIRQKFKPKEESLGSGWLKIDGNLDTEFHLQTDITF